MDNLKIESKTIYNVKKINGMFKLIEKFEIKSHDGPGRVGKINDAITPKLFFKNDIKIAPYEGSAFNV